MKCSVVVVFRKSLSVMINVASDLCSRPVQTTTDISITGSREAGASGALCGKSFNGRVMFNFLPELAEALKREFSYQYIEC